SHQHHALAVSRHAITLPVRRAVVRAEILPRPVVVLPEETDEVELVDVHLGGPGKIAIEALTLCRKWLGPRAPAPVGVGPRVGAEGRDDDGRQAPPDETGAAGHNRVEC